MADASVEVYATSVVADAMEVDVAAVWDTEVDATVEAETLDAFDVAVTSVEADADETAAQRSKALVDAVLLTAEVSLGTLAMRFSDMFTPDDAKEWEQLRSFRDQTASDKASRAARAREKLIEELTDGISRK